jgi:choline dehydrogenase-like flavoprotein
VLSDARALASGTTLAADICIIGGGAAGITLALDLMGSGLRTLVLESGGTTGPDEATQALAGGESIGRPIRSLVDPIPLERTRLRWLGGTTNHWAGFCRPLETVDFEPRDRLAVSGWPIDRATLLPYWERAANYCRITDATDDPEVWAERSGLAPPLPANGTLRSTTFQIAAFMRFGEAYMSDLAAAADVEVLLWANAVNLATADGSSIDAVDVRTLSGVSLRVEAAAYVLASGGLENPRLLLASTDHDPAGVGNGHDLVGRHFTEHLQIAGGFGLIDVDPADLAGYQGTEVTIADGRFAGQTHGVRYALSLTPEHVRAEPTTGLEAQLIVDSLPGGVPEQAGGVKAGDVSELLGRLTGTPPAAGIYTQLLAEQRLDPGSRVTLGSTRDALGLPTLRLDWRYGPADRAGALGGLRTMAEQLGAMGLGRLQIVAGGALIGSKTPDPDHYLSQWTVDLDAVDPDDFPIGVGFHHMCTTRMADSPTEGVVDAHCRVHDVDNLWVAGSSVFGTGGVATPTFTIVALAIRLADHLRDQLT